MRGRWPKLLIHTIYHNTQWVKNNFKKSHNTSYISLFSNIWLIVYLPHEELHVGIGNEPNIRKKCQPCKYLVCTVFKSWNMKFVNNFCYVTYICTCTYHLLKIRFTTKQNVCDGQINVHMYIVLAKIIDIPL